MDRDKKKHKEGRAGQTKPDFIAKNFISLKESRETRFWLRVIGTTDPPLQKELEPFLREANECIAMLTTSLKNARLSQSRGTQNMLRLFVFRSSLRLFFRLRTPSRTTLSRTTLSGTSPS
jgi:predicted RNA-binding Zn ribbon-like protein